MGQQWEYCVVTYVDDESINVAYLDSALTDLSLATRKFDAVFRALGLAEWELVGMAPYSVASTSFYFKRPVKPGREIDEPKFVF